MDPTIAMLLSGFVVYEIPPLWKNTYPILWDFENINKEILKFER